MELCKAAAVTLAAGTAVRYHIMLETAKRSPSQRAKGRKEEVGRDLVPTLLAKAPVPKGSAKDEESPEVDPKGEDEVPLGKARARAEAKERASAGKERAKEKAEFTPSKKTSPMTSANHSLNQMRTTTTTTSTRMPTGATGNPMGMIPSATKSHRSKPTLTLAKTLIGQTTRM